jgi:endoglucanase
MLGGGCRVLTGAGGSKTLTSARLGNAVLLSGIAFLFAGHFLCGQAEANPMLHAASGYVVDQRGAPVSLRCVNLSPWLDPEPYLLVKAFRALETSPSELKQRLAQLVGPDEAQSFWQQWEDAFVTEEDFKRLAKAGFTCVRLPINYKDILNGVETGKGALDESRLFPVDQAVAWGEKYDIYVMIDLHVAPGGQNTAPTVADVPSNDQRARLWEGSMARQNQELTIALWRALAARYGKARSVGGYDLLNEPVLPPGVSKQTLRGLYSAITTAIRSVDPDHMIILEGDKYAHDFSALEPPPDANVMYEFHEYSLGQRAWGTPNQEALEPFIKLRASSGMPLWLGEFGENSLDWQKQMVQLMKSNEIGWAVWPWKRIALDNGHPVIESIVVPDSWNKLSKYAVGAIFTGKPTAPQAREGMEQILRAIRTQNCEEDLSLEGILAER